MEGERLWHVGLMLYMMLMIVWFASMYFTCLPLPVMGY